MRELIVSMERNGALIEARFYAGKGFVNQLVDQVRATSG
jgi:hypothetical protein